MTNTNDKVVGIDVSKAHLDVSVAAGAPRRFPNTAPGIGALLAWLADQDIARVVYEPTGGYERPLAQALTAAGLPAWRAHPNRVRARHPVLDTGPGLWTVGQDRPAGRPGPGPLRRRL